ncbi:arylsulfatase [Clostridium sediminicola]|uniref:sulfatase family protein n=1 Tax=Clostridium sediminicola TaxID=3114879 RepID=UPI0031F21438
MKEIKNGSDLSIANALQRHYEKIGKKDERPNVLIIMTDQQRHDTIAHLGNDHMITPNLDRLAREGCSYTNAYTPNPICCPARHSFLTGISTGNHGIADNDFNARLAPDIVTFPRILSQGDYVTEAIGKMHFQPCREHHGFQRLKLMEEVPEHREDDDYLLYLKEMGYGNVQNIHGVRNLLFYAPQTPVIPEEHHGTTWVTDRGLEFIDSNAGKRPFLLYLSYISPHPPFNCYNKYSDLYKEKDIPKPAESQTPLCELSKENKMFGDLPNEKYIRRMRESYYGLITQIDYNIGRIIKSIEDNGELDNTLIIFTSDHGDFIGDYGLYQKFLPYDSCARIPLLVRYPKSFDKGTVKEEFVDLTDIFPTVLDISELDYKGNYPLVGESLISKNKRKDRTHQYVAYSEGNRRWASVRNKEYKYNYYYGGGKEELFDLVDDPSETTNLLYSIESKEILEIKNSLRRKLVQYEKEQWKAEYIVNDDFIVLDDYKAVATRNKAFPVFGKNIKNKSDKENLNDFIDEVIRAVEGEDLVKFEDLDYKAWQKNGNFSEEDLERLFNKRYKNKNF